MALQIDESEQSRLDIASIWEFIAYGNPISGDIESADRVIDAILRTYHHLSEFPHRRRVDTRGHCLAPVNEFP